jgi:hypothetical protein
MTAPQPGFIRRHWIPTVLRLMVVTPILIFILWTAITLNYSYSKGTRAGILQKVSKRGWLCKTWEGELQMTAIPGAAPEKFIFSARSDSIAAVLSQMSGQHVVLTYEQHKGVPGSCFGDTEYFITDVRASPTP